MKILTLLIINLCLINLLYGQKHILDTTDINHWVSVSDPKISSNGKYVSYMVSENYKKNCTLTIQSVDKRWKLEVKNVISSTFTKFGNKAIYKLSNDSLIIYSIDTKEIERIANIKSYRIISTQGKEYLLYLRKSIKRELITRELSSKIDRCFTGVADYIVSENQNALILKRDSGNQTTLSWLDVNKAKEFKIGRYTNVESITFDHECNQIVFIAGSNEDTSSQKVIWQYFKSISPTIIARNNNPGIKGGLMLGSIEKFSNDGNRLFINLNKAPSGKHSTHEVLVDVWNYQDLKLQSQQLTESFNGQFMAVLNLRNGKIVQIQQDNENIDFLSESIDIIVKVQSTASSWEERDWNPNSKCSDFLVNCITGIRTELPLKNIISISPDGRYLIGYNDPWKATALLSYKFSTGEICQLTKDINFPENDADYSIDNDVSQVQFAGWQNNEPILFLYDEFDIWKVDLRNPSIGLNYTNGFGRKNHMIFRFAYQSLNVCYDPYQTKLLIAFDNNSKQNGFFKVPSRKFADPNKLILESAFYYLPDVPGIQTSMFPVIKAKDANVWIVRKETANSSRNYYLTKNFVEFTKLSDIKPEQNVSWLKSELVNFKSLTGIPTQGILYKPENFDENKKYPLIIHFYEKKSNELNIYMRPEMSTGSINIPWFVSRGYIVFTPDIHYQKGEPGISAFNSIAGAAKYLIRLSYIDSTKMGIQGHSFGGYETNFIITQTPIFKAAMSASGPSDLVSLYNSLWDLGFSRQGQFEHGQFRFQSTLWQNKDAYFRNSPIIYADQVVTPLLMMNNKRDGAIPFDQGVEYFTALRRLGKRVWMLQYDTEGHTVHDENAFDFTIRVNQFFDYYLKGGPLPIWISKGIKADQKGIINGFMER